MGQVDSPSDRWRGWALRLGIILTAGLAWLLLGRWIPGGSERFYLLVPPVVLACWAVRPPEERLRYRPVLVGVGGLACLGVFNGLAINWSLGLRGLDLVVSWLRPGEVLAAAYFLGALLLLAGLTRNALGRSVHWLDAKLLGRPTGEGARWPGARSLARQVLPAVLLMPLLVPYALAALFIHRMKVPNRVTPQEFAGRAFEHVAFTTRDGFTIRAWFIPARQESSRTLLICHGLGANRSAFLPLTVVGDAIDAHVLIFDFRGHGDSDGHTVSLGYYEKGDVLAAVEYLRQRRPGQARQLVGLGISMGSAGLIRAAAEVEPPFDAVIIDSGFCSAVELADSVLAAFPAGLRPGLIRAGVPLASLHAGCPLAEVRPVEQIGALRAPVLIIHALRDTMIPADHARRLYERAAAPRALWLPDTGVHGSAFFGAREEYLEQVRRLVASIGPGSPGSPERAGGETR